MKHFHPEKMPPTEYFLINPSIWRRKWRKYSELNVFLSLATCFVLRASCSGVAKFTRPVSLLKSVFRTALILGCEFSCKDAVEVLLKSGADVKAVDGLGHDAYHYTRFSKDPELIAMVRSYLEKANRGQPSEHKRTFYIHLFGINGAEPLQTDD